MTDPLRQKFMMLLFGFLSIVLYDVATSAASIMYPGEDELNIYMRFFIQTTGVVGILVVLVMRFSPLKRFSVRPDLIVTCLLLILAIFFGHTYSHLSKNEEFVLYFMLVQVVFMFAVTGLIRFLMRTSSELKGEWKKLGSSVLVGLAGVFFGICGSYAVAKTDFLIPMHELYFSAILLLAQIYLSFKIKQKEVSTA